MTATLTSKLESAMRLINACNAYTTYEDIKLHIDAPVTPAALRSAERMRRGLDHLAEDHGLSRRLMRRLSALSRSDVRSALTIAVALSSARGLPKQLRRRAATTVVLFLDSRWRDVALDVTRPLRESIEPQRNRHARMSATSPDLCVALMSIFADCSADDCDRAWALRQLESCKAPVVQAISVFRHIPDAVLRGSVPLEIDGKSLLMVQQPAVLADPAWVESLVPYCHSYSLHEIPARALRVLPAPQSVDIALLYLERHVLSNRQVAVEWVNSYRFEETIPYPLRTHNVLLGLLTLDGLRADRRNLLLEWFALASDACTQVCAA